MNYRHSYHAGNFADCLKHLVLVQIIKLMQKKEKGLMVLDAFSGTGIYDLHTEISARSPEYIDGIAKIWDYADKNQNLAPAISDYLLALKTATPSQRYYAGSPFFIAYALRPQDRAFFVELHPQDVILLKENLSQIRQDCACQSFFVENIDGYQSVKAKLPPSEKRGLIFIDPPFEKPDEFRNMINSLKDGLKRFETGVFALWYADKNTTETRDFLKKVKNLECKYINVSMQLQNKNEIKGLVSAGLVIINPPFGLLEALKAAIGQLTKILGKNEGAKFVLEASQSI
jgi:23S rRNA (adenine2030-N6)-methyltransferase